MNKNIYIQKHTHLAYETTLQPSLMLRTLLNESYGRTVKRYMNTCRCLTATVTSTAQTEPVRQVVPWVTHS
jgi:hypothetical protein